MKNRVRISCYIPVLYLLVDKDYREEFDRMKKEAFDDLLALDSQIPFDLNEFGSQNLNIKMVAPSKNLIKKAQDEYGEKFRTYPIILDSWIKFEILPKMKIVFRKLETSERGKKSWKEIPKTQLKAWNLGHLISIFTEELSKLLFTLTIARPGIMRIGTGFVTVNGKILKLPWKQDLVDFEDGHLSEVLEEAFINKWPKIYSLDIKKTWLWLRSIQGVTSGFSNCDLGRAINAYSYAGLRDDRIGSDLLWPLMGLEALYVSGDRKVEQLKKNIQSFLGPLPNGNMIDRIYKHRSGFVHGKINIKNAHTVDEFSEATNYIRDKDYTAILNTVAMLIATIQKIFLSGNRPNKGL